MLLYERHWGMSTLVCSLVPFNWLPQVDAVLSPATSYLVDILRDRSAEAMAANKSVGSHQSHLLRF